MLHPFVEIFFFSIRLQHVGKKYLKVPQGYMFLIALCVLSAKWFPHVYQEQDDTAEHPRPAPTTGTIWATVFAQSILMRYISLCSMCTLKNMVTDLHRDKTRADLHRDKTIIGGCVSCSLRQMPKMQITFRCCNCAVIIASLTKSPAYVNRRVQKTCLWFVHEAVDLHVISLTCTHAIGLNSSSASSE